MISVYDRLRVSDQENILVRTFLQEFLNHGGSDRELEILLQDAAGEREWFRKAIRRLMPIYDLVEQPVDIGTVDFHIPSGQFYKQYPEVYIHPAARIDHKHCWIDKPPDEAKNFLYQLVHYPRKMEYNEIVADIEPAGYRELIAYLDWLRRSGEHEKMKGFDILALGSQMIYRKGHEPSPGAAIPPTFPLGEFNHPDNRLVVIYKEFCRDEKQIFGHDACFFLARVPVA